METKLHGWHRANGARMVDFGGWDMPVQYETGPREEHLRVQTWDVSRLKPGRAHYSMILNDSGGIVAVRLEGHDFIGRRAREARRPGHDRPLQPQDRQIRGHGLRGDRLCRCRHRGEHRHQGRA